MKLTFYSILSLFQFKDKLTELDTDQRDIGYVVALFELDTARLHIRDRTDTASDTNVSERAHVSQCNSQVSHGDRVDQRSHVPGQIPRTFQLDNDAIEASKCPVGFIPIE